MKNRELKTIWKAPKYLPFIQPDLTDEILRDAEKKVDCKLPTAYVDLLKIQNGGYIRYEISGIPHNQIFGIGSYFPSATDVDWIKEYDELNGLIPFDGDGHWFICFDYRNNKIDPAIIFIDIECGKEEFIAKNFNQYLDILKLDAGDEYVIETNLSIEETVKEISRIAKIHFEDPEFYNHGYACYRGKFNKSWVWISPNKVPSGFVRDDDDRYDELSSIVPTTSLRYPEVSENCIFISVSDEKARDKLFIALAKQSIKTESLKSILELGG